MARLFIIWAFLLGSLLGGIQNAFSYSDTNLDISDVVFPLACYARNTQDEQPRRTGQTGQSEQEDIEEKGTPREESLEPIIQKYSERYSVRASLVRCIIFKESSNNANAVGDKGKAVGCAQFHLPTFQSFRKQMGESQEDTRTNPDHSIATLSWALSKGLGNHWTPFKRGLCR